MKTLFAASALALVMLSGCAGIPGAGANFDVDKFVNNPACAHDDELTGVTGAAGIPASLQFKVARHCPAPSPAAAGAVVAPVTPPANP